MPVNQCFTDRPTRLLNLDSGDPMQVSCKHYSFFEKLPASRERFLERGRELRADLVVGSFPGIMESRANTEEVR